VVGSSLSALSTSAMSNSRADADESATSSQRSAVAAPRCDDEMHGCDTDKHSNVTTALTAPLVKVALVFSCCCILITFVILVMWYGNKCLILYCFTAW